MKTRTKTLAVMLAVVLGAATAVLLGLHQTLYGLMSQKLFTWKEESFSGRPLSELQSDLISKEKHLCQ